MRPGIGAAELAGSCARATLGSCAQSRAAVSIAGEPPRATIDAMIIATAPGAGRGVRMFMPIPHYDRLTEIHR
jgi:hypothetical protein